MITTVLTETSTYLLDDEAMTATRLPGRGAGPNPDAIIPASLATLRRDAEPIPLMAMPTNLRVGEPMRLFLRVREDGIPTVRDTTIVMEIRR